VRVLLLLAPWGLIFWNLTFFDDAMDLFLFPKTLVILSFFWRSGRFTSELMCAKGEKGCRVYFWAELFFF
jgi:hypothetical protein